MESQTGFFTGGLYPSEDLGLFEEVFQNAGEAITIFDEDGAYHAFNPAFLRLTGYSVEELLDPGFAPVIAMAPEDERSMIQGRLQEALLGQGPIRYERHFIKKDGTSTPANVTLVKLKKRPSWPKDRILAVVTDTSSIKAKEAELHRLYRVIDRAPLGILIADRERRVSYANAFLRTMAQNEGESKPSQEPCERLLKTALCDTPDCPGKLALQEGIPQKGENVLPGPSRPLIVSQLAQPFWDGDRVSGLAEYFIDISDIKQKEKDLAFVIQTVQATLERVRQGSQARILKSLLPKEYERLADEINATIDTLTKQQNRLLEAREKLEYTSTFLKTVLDEAQDGILAILQDGGILMANKTARLLLSEPNLPGKNITAFLQDEALLLCQRRILEHGNDGLCPGHESTLRTQEGAPIEVLCHHRLVTHPNVFEPCVLFSFTDIRRIKATTRYLERLLALLPIAYKLDDPETGRILDANRAFLDWFGYSLEELKAKTWMDLTPKRYLNQGLNLAKKSLETGEIVWEDKAYIAKDGREIPIRHGYTHIYHPGFGKTLALCLTLPKSETAPFP